LVLLSKYNNIPQLASQQSVAGQDVNKLFIQKSLQGSFRYVVSEKLPNSNHPVYCSFHLMVVMVVIIMMCMMVCMILIGVVRLMVELEVIGDDDNDDDGDDISNYNDNNKEITINLHCVDVRC
jgi:hypothetical protein